MRRLLSATLTIGLVILPASLPADPQRPGGGGPGPAAREQGMSNAEHGAIFELLSRHDTILRKVEEIPGGVRTTTKSTKPELVGTLRTHVRQMARHLEQKQPVRMWDPAFRDIFAHAGEIKMVMRDIDGGIEVTETSENPAVVPMIRALCGEGELFRRQGA